MDAYVNSWEDFLLDRISTTTHTDALIELMRVVDKITEHPEEPTDPL
jgi:hypothetical protein